MTFIVLVRGDACIKYLNVLQFVGFLTFERFQQCSAFQTIEYLSEGAGSQRGWSGSRGRLRFTIRKWDYEECATGRPHGWPPPCTTPLCWLWPGIKDACTLSLSFFLVASVSFSPPSPLFSPSPSALVLAVCVQRGLEE